MKQKKVSGTGRIFIRAFNLFYSGKSVQVVAYKLRISLGQAKRIYQIYLQNEKMADQILEDKEITDHYKKSLAAKGKESAERKLRYARKKLQKMETASDFVINSLEKYEVVDLMVWFHRDWGVIFLKDFSILAQFVKNAQTEFALN